LIFNFNDSPAAAGSHARSDAHDLALERLCDGKHFLPRRLSPFAVERKRVR